MFILYIYLNTDQKKIFLTIPFLIKDQETNWSLKLHTKARQCIQTNLRRLWQWGLTMTHWRESLIIETSTAASSLYALLRLSVYSVIIQAVKSLLTPSILLYENLTVCCKFQAQSWETRCFCIHYLEIHGNLAGKDAFSVLNCWTHYEFTSHPFFFIINKRQIKNKI